MTYPQIRHYPSFSGAVFAGHMPSSFAAESEHFCCETAISDGNSLLIFKNTSSAILLFGRRVERDHVPNSSLDASAAGRRTRDLHETVRDVPTPPTGWETRDDGRAPTDATS